MAYKTIRKDGRNITINTETGQEIKPGEGLLGDLLKQSGLTTLGGNLPSMFQQLGRDLSNLPRDISRATVYSDKVDDKGRPLTIAQANPEPYKPISGMAVAQGARPKASGTKIKIGDKYYDTGFHSKEISELRKQNPGGGNAAQSVTTGLNTGTGSRDARLDPNAKDLPGVMYVTNFKEGQSNMDAMQDYFKGQKNGENLATWAKANPALAYKEYSKAMSKEKAADMAAYEEDYGSPMNQQSEQVFEQGKPDVITTSQFDVLNSPTELSAPGKAAYDLAMGNTNFIGQQDIPTADNTQEFLATQMKKLGLVK